MGEVGPWIFWARDCDDEKGGGVGARTGFLDVLDVVLRAVVLRAVVLFCVYGCLVVEAGACVDFCVFYFYFFVFLASVWLVGFFSTVYGP